MKKWIRIGIGAAILIILLILIKICFFSADTVTAEHGVMEDWFDADGILVLNESIIDSYSSGTLETYYSEGERVPKGTKVASIHTGEVDSEVQKNLNAINLRIQELESQQSEVILFEEDAAKLGTMISERTKEIIQANSSGNLALVKTLKEDINLLLDKKSALSGGTSISQGTLDKLYQQKKQYESQLKGNITDLTAPIAGTFSTKMDGYENILTIDGIKKMSVTDLTTILKSNPKEEETVTGLCKIVDGYQWYFLSIVDETVASALKEGQTLSLRSSLTNDSTVGASVYYISEPEEGRCVIAISSHYDITSSLTTRKMEFEVVKARYEGLKIPTRALRVSDGEEGVYVKKETGKQFKKVDVIHKEEEYTIVRENNADPDMLLLYDEVVVKQ